MTVLLFLLIIVAIFVLFIVPELRRALLTKGTLLLIAFLTVALLSFAVGYCTHLFAEDRSYRIEPRLMSAINFIEGHQLEKDKLPSNAEFKAWAEDHGNWFSYHHTDGSDTYLISVWNGDENQVYDPTNHQLRFE